MKYNEEHGIVPQALNKKVGELLDIGQGANQKRNRNSVEKRQLNRPHFTMHLNQPKNSNNKLRNWNNKCINLLKILSLKKPLQYAINFIN